MVEVVTSYNEILDKLYQNPCMLLAGGTDLMVKHRRDAQLTPDLDEHVLLIHQCSELQYVIEDVQGIHIGSLTRLEDLLTHPLIPQILKDAIAEMASVAIRNVATLGGNIGNASPAGDSLPVLYVLNAQIVLDSVEGERIIPIEEFILGPGQTCRNKNELIKEIIIEHETKPYLYKKIGSRKADTISKLSFAGMYQLEDGHVSDIRVAFGAVFKTIVRNREVESKVVELLNSVTDYTKVNMKTINEIVALYEPLIVPIDDQRSSKEYRKKISKQVLIAFLKGIGGD